MRYVIAGAGPAGISAAKTLRQLDRDGEIVLVSKDDQVHSRCMLHKYLGGERDAEGISFIPPGFFKQNNITWYPGRAMVRLDCAERRILLDDGTFLPYDRLLLATGAYYLLPPVPGLKEAENVYGFRDLSDALAIDKAVRPGARAVIIGSGLVGMDAAYALMERGISPVIVEMAGRILPLQLDAEAASEYQRLFEHHGCSFRLAARASRTRLDSRGNVSALVLEDGEELACDFIIAAAGVRPEIRFLEHCSVETGRAVTVDQYLSTSVPGVYGAGDVCGLSGIWPNAMKQGAVAAKNMYGIPTPYEDTYAMKNTMNFFGLPALCIGDINRLDSHTLVITEEDSQNYRKALVEDGVLKSILMVGNISGSGIYQYLIKNQIKLPSADRSIFRLSFADFYGFDTSKGSYTWDTDLCCGKVSFQISQNPRKIHLPGEFYCLGTISIQIYYFMILAYKLAEIIQRCLQLYQNQRFFRLHG